MADVVPQQKVRSFGPGFRRNKKKNQEVEVYQGELPGDVEYIQQTNVETIPPLPDSYNEMSAENSPRLTRKPSNPRVEMLKEKLGLTRDVSTSSDEDMPEHHYSSRVMPPLQEIPTEMNENSDEIVHNTTQPTVPTGSDRDWSRMGRRSPQVNRMATQQQAQQQQQQYDQTAAPSAAASRMPKRSAKSKRMSQQIPDQQQQQQQYYDPSAQGPVGARKEMGKFPDKTDMLIIAAGIAIGIGTLVQKHRKNQKLANGGQKPAGGMLNNLKEKVMDKMYLSKPPKVQDNIAVSEPQFVQQNLGTTGTTYQQQQQQQPVYQEEVYYTSRPASNVASYKSTPIQTRMTPTQQRMTPTVQRLTPTQRTPTQRVL